MKPVNDDRSSDDDLKLTRISTIDKQKHESNENEGGNDPEPIPDKGKAIDPREWGNLEISDKELDTQAQAKALKIHECYKELHKKSKQKAKKRAIKKPAKEIAEEPKKLPNVKKN